MPSLHIRRRAIPPDALCLIAHRPTPACRRIPIPMVRPPWNFPAAVDWESALAVLILVIALIVILIGAELFTNGIEWVGRKLDLAEGAVGSVLAAVGTALPETMIPIIAILFAGGEASHEVGIGAILGAPFMLSTLAMFVTGVGVLAFRARRSTGEDMRIDAPT